MIELELISRARSYGDKIALHTEARDYTYAEILDRSASLAASFLKNTDDLAEARIAFLAPAGFAYITTQWAIWRAGGVAMPLCLSATEPELEYALTNSESIQVITTRENAAKVTDLCARLNLRLTLIEDVDDTPEKTLPEISSNRRGMILYTSGTTSKPKGVVTTHANIQAQIESLVEAWEWQAMDRIPLFLPLHHIHGIINIASCALWSGASIEPFPPFRYGDHTGEGL